MSVVLMSWCPGQGCDPCKLPPGSGQQKPPHTVPGDLSFNTVVDIQIHEFVYPKSGMPPTDVLIGGSTVYQGQSPSWYNGPIYVPTSQYDFVQSIAIIVKSTVFPPGYAPAQMSDIGAAGYDNASVQSAVQSAVNQAQKYVNALPPL